MNEMTNVRFSPRRLGHLNVFVADVEASAAFYRDVCGFQEVFREPGISMIFLSNGNTHHDLGLMEITPAERIGRDGHIQVSTGNGRTPGLNHLGFEMETEKQLVDAYRRATNERLPISRTTDHQIAHSVYMTEINGHTLEFYADVVDDWREVYANNEGKLLTGHWDPGAAKPLEEQKAVFERELYRCPSSLLSAQKVAYACLPVRDLESSLRYYTDVVGLTSITVDRSARFAVLSGSAKGGCDLCLMETRAFPSVRLLFGGVQLHGGRPIDESIALLRERNIPAILVGPRDTGAVVVIDPDGIPLVYSTAPAQELMSSFGPRIVDEIRKLAVH
jgi:catechol 2,3-dioxygenase